MSLMNSLISLINQNTMLESAEVVSSVDDLLMQIMLWLPVKSLMRFKLVSKDWKSLITSPEFTRMWDPNPNPAVGLFYPNRVSRQGFEYIPLDTKVIDPPLETISFPDDPFAFWIQQSCNGLLLCCSSEGSSGSGNSWYRGDNWCPIRRCYIYNPNTKCFSRLPRPGVLHGVPRIVHGVNLAFVQTKSTSYKVVCIRGSELARELHQIEVYSPETAVWKVCGEPFKATASFHSGVYWNGSIVWFSYTTHELLYFHVEKEKLGKMPLPAEENHPDRRGRGLFMGESCSHLHVIQRYDIEFSFNVYEIKRDYSEWFVKYRVDLAAVASAVPAVSYTNAVMKKICILSLVRGRECPYMVLHLSHKVVRFNIEDGSFEEIRDLKDSVTGSPCAFEYIESLASV